MALEQYTEVTILPNPRLSDTQLFPPIYYSTDYPGRGLVTFMNAHTAVDITKIPVSYRGECMSFFHNLIAIRLSDADNRICLGNIAEGLEIVDIILRNNTVSMQIPESRINREAQEYVERYAQSLGAVSEAAFRTTQWMTAVNYHKQYLLNQDRSCVYLEFGRTNVIGRDLNADFVVTDRRISPAHLAVALVRVPDTIAFSEEYVVIRDLSNTRIAKVY